jgi:myo-inositol-1(or 4)-monophosphatase
MAIAFEQKSDLSQVTELDLKIENQLKEKLKLEFPELGFEGEETGSDRHDGQAYWIVDPIDGTSSFIRGIVGCTNMAALVYDGQSIAAIIYDFINDELFTARRGQGAFRDGQPISVKQRPARGSAVYSGKFNIADDFRDYIQGEGIAIFRPLGSSGMSFALLAQGKIDGYSLLDMSAKPHDTAPGVLLATEAGAQVVTADGEGWFVGKSDFITANDAVAEATLSFLN